MKKLLAVLCAAAMLLVVLPAGIVGAEEENWIEVRTVEDLYNVRNDLTANYKLMNDIDLSVATAAGGDWDFMGNGWNPIGSNNIYGASSFSGVFDGNGYSIIGMRIEVSSLPSGTGGAVYLGLFAQISGTVRNLTMEQSVVSSTVYKLNEYIGGIVGNLLSGGSIENCTNLGRVLCVYKFYIRDTSHFGYCGGITGYSAGAVIRCRNIGDIKVDIENGASYGYGYARAGGIVGSCTDRDTTVSQCYNTGVVSAHGYRGAAGGICGTSGTVSQCYNSGSITATYYSAGISVNGKISQCYNTGLVNSGQGQGYGVGSGTITNSYYLSGTGSNTAGATELTDTQMKLQSVYSGFDFDTVWTMAGREDYPYPELRDVPLIYQIAGSDQIVGTPAYGETLSADLSTVTPAGTPCAVEWLVNDQVVSRSRTYTVAATDIGKTLQFRITSTDDGVIGSFRSQPVVMTKAQPVQELQAPQLQAKSDTTLSVVPVAGQVYSLDAATWQESGDFTGLTPNTTYRVYTTVPETDTHFGTAISSPLAVTTDKTDLQGGLFIEGDPYYGRELTLDASALAPEYATYTLEWRRDGYRVAGGDSYVIGADDVGHMLSAAAVGNGGTQGEIVSAQIEALPCDINEATARNLSAQIYSTEAFTPAVTLQYAGQTLVEDQDFTVVYLDNISVGDARVLIYGTGNYSGWRELNFKINPKSVAALTYSSIPTQNYTGEAIRPAITVSYNGYTLVENVDYTLTYANNTNPGPATVTVEGKGNFSGSSVKPFTIVQNLLSEADVTVERVEYPYTGSAVTPSFTVAYNGRPLRSGVDYTYSYQNNVQEGDGQILLKGMGGYKGEKLATFKITGHIWGEWTVRTAPNCVNEGVEYRVCPGCGKEETRAILATGHHYVVTSNKEATCSETGLVTYACTVCGSTYAEEPEKLPHTVVNDPAVAPTCTSTGLTAGSHCSVCHAVLKVQNVVAKTPHNYSTEWTVDVAPTCEVPGSKSHHCVDCDAKIDLTTISALGHDWHVAQRQDPSCTEEGSIGYVCAHDDSHVKSDPIPALGHTAGEWTIETPVGCEQDGSRVLCCVTCGDVLERETIPATGHEWGEWAVEKAATVEEEGIEARVCAHCSEKETRSIDKLEPIDETVPGDIDGKEGVTAADALMALQAATGKIALNAEQQAAADVDGSGDVTAADALMILQYATEKITAFAAKEP
ncbi:MAG: dockerin type I domain-containing protein [Acutalibacteraceae bacterium]|jgi:hypothetical protein